MKNRIYSLVAAVGIVFSASAAVTVAPPAYWAYSLTDITGTNAYVPGLSTNLNAYTATQVDLTRYTDWAVMVTGYLTNGEAASAACTVRLQFYPSADGTYFASGSGAIGRNSYNLYETNATPYTAYLPVKGTNWTGVLTNWTTGGAAQAGYWKYILINTNEVALHAAKIYVVGKIPIK